MSTVITSSNTEFSFVKLHVRIFFTLQFSARGCYAYHVEYYTQVKSQFIALIAYTFFL